MYLSYASTTACVQHRAKECAATWPTGFGSSHEQNNDYL